MKEPQPRLPVETHDISSLTLWRASRRVFRSHGRNSQWVRRWRTIFEGAECLRDFIGLEKERLDVRGAVRAFWRKFRWRSRKKYRLYKIRPGITFDADLHRDCPIPAILDSLQPVGLIHRVRLGRKLARLTFNATYCGRAFSDAAVVANVTRVIAVELALELPSPQECVLLRRLVAQRRMRRSENVRYKWPSDPDIILAELGWAGIPIDRKAPTLNIPHNVCWTGKVRLLEALSRPRDDGKLGGPMSRLERLPDVAIPEVKTGNLKPQIDSWRRGLATKIGAHAFPVLEVDIRSLLGEE